MAKLTRCAAKIVEDYALEAARLRVPHVKKNAFDEKVLTSARSRRVHQAVVL